MSEVRFVELQNKIFNLFDLGKYDEVHLLIE